jgi:ABC-type phosphate transport system substrate-binding protein
MGWSLALTMIWLGFASRSIASSDDFKVIVNRDNPTHVVDRSFLRDIYMKKATNWSDGAAARPIDLPTGTPTHERFALAVLSKRPAQLRSYWLQRIFSGTGVPPPEAPSIAAAVAYVRANRGAVAYLPLDANSADTKVIEVR